MAMIQFACSGCGRSLRIADTEAGKKTRCPRCGEPLRIPDSTLPSGPAGGAEAATLPPPSAATPAAQGATLEREDPLPQATSGPGAASVPGYEILGELGRGGMGV